MSKYQEAFDTLSCLASTDHVICECNKIKGRENCLKCDTDKALEVLKEIVERATPKKPIKSEPLKEDVQIGHAIFRKGTSVLRLCPECDGWVKPIDNYCPICGQALDWGMKMTAKEMFEELGFKKYVYGDVEVEYRKQESAIYTRKIKFDLESKLVFSTNSNCRVVGINTQELKAINKQVEELGWI